MSEASAPEFDDGEIFQGIAGCLVGLAVGDALGTAVEFQSPGAFEELTDMIGGGAFDLNPGQVRCNVVSSLGCKQKPKGAPPTCHIF